MLSEAQKLCYSVVNILELLKVENNVLQPEGLAPYEDKTYKDVSNKIGKTEDKTVKEIINIVEKVKPDKKVEDIERRAKQAGNVVKKHGNKVAKPASDAVKDNSIKVYTDVKDKLDNKFGKSIIGKQFGVADELAIELINDWTHVFIGNHYRDEVSQLVIDEIIDIFREEQALAVREIAAKLEKSLPGLIKQKGYFDVVAGQVLNLTRSWSNMNFLQEAKIERYQVVAIIDGRTSAICRYMDGREFEVRRTLDKYGRYADANDIDDVKAVSPWATTIGSQLAVGDRLLTPDLTGPELQAMGIDAPPFHARSYHKDTEVCTESGWKLIKDVAIGEKCMSLNPDTLDIEYVSVINTNRHHEDNLINFKSKTCDISVTHDHKMFYQSNDDRWKKRDRYKFIDAEDFLGKKRCGNFYSSSKWIGQEGLIDKNMAEFLGYYLSDGNFYLTKSKNYTIQIRQQEKNNEIVFNKILECCKKITGNNISSKNDRIIFSEKRLFNYLKQFGKCRDKFIPDEIMKSGKDIIRIFLDAFLLCDSHVRYRKLSNYDNGNVYKETNYYTSSKRMADQLGELIVKVGRRPSYSVVHKKDSVYNVNGKVGKRNADVISIRECANQNISVDRLNISKVKYDDMVYCLELEKFHTLYVRKNGRCVWSGNCRSTVVALF